MPIKIPNDLPARATLEAEGVMVMSEADAARQDIRPLRIGLLNLMPNKISTETQFARLIGATPLQVELTLVKITNHTPKNTPTDHMIAFYRDWEEMRAEKFDGFIVTGAPVELPIRGRDLLGRTAPIFDWTQTNVHSTFNICWGAQAAAPSFPRRAEASRLPRRPSASTATQPQPGLALSARLLRRFLDSRCRAGPRCVATTFRRRAGSKF